MQPIQEMNATHADMRLVQGVDCRQQLQRRWRVGGSGSSLCLRPANTIGASCFFFSFASDWSVLASCSALTSSEEPLRRASLASIADPSPAAQRAIAVAITVRCKAPAFECDMTPMLRRAAAAAARWLGIAECSWPSLGNSTEIPSSWVLSLLLPQNRKIANT